MRTLMPVFGGVVMIVVGVAIATIIKLADPNSLINDILAMAQATLLGGIGVSMLEDGWREFQLKQASKAKRRRAFARRP